MWNHAFFWFIVNSGQVDEVCNGVPVNWFAGIEYVSLEQYKRPVEHLDHGFLVSR
jgi:hypothetical protein